MQHAADSVLPRGGRAPDTFRSTSLVEERTIARVKVLYGAEGTLQTGASATVALAALFPVATGRLLLAILSVALWVARALLAR